VESTGDPRLSRPLKAAVTALALAGLLGVVALAAQGAHPSGTARVHQREVPARVSNDLLTIVVIAYVLALVALIVAGLALRDTSVPLPPRRSRWRQLLVLVVVLGMLSLLGHRAINASFGDQQRGQLQTGGAGRGSGTVASRPAGERPAQFDWVLAGAVGGGLALAAVVLLARRRRPAAAVEGEETLEKELAAAVTDTIDDLRREADPRRAVVAAYVRMEGVFGGHGHPRRASEAPFEYLARILLALRVGAAPVHDLTELFERAKFSTHEIDQQMRERAIAALVAVRDDLRTA
jgi:Domain of unknown function (DUF4129)